MEAQQAKKDKTPAFKARWRKFERWFKRNDGYRKAELLTTIGAIVLSFFALKSSNEALSITQSQFTQSNEPFLQIEIDCEKAPLSPFGNWPTEVHYKLTNLGDYPVKILSGHNEIFSDSNRRQEYKITYSAHPINRFLITEDQISKVTTPFYSDSLTSSWDIAELAKFNNYEKYIFFTGYYNYVNLANKQLYMYKFLIRITNTYPYSYFLYNRNEKFNEFLSDERLFEDGE
ncbi:MAG: hypothetical protein JNK14_15390 [Chitinophagaceae bacterium]|nr:hypothetical protein [Chitinophagaceae bacterium]